MGTEFCHSALAKKRLFASVEETGPALPSSPNVVSFCVSESVARKMVLLRQYAEELVVVGVVGDPAWT